ncbi:hypothetical protein H696_03500 [Fonticula alba]|uniref:FCH domain-containing protein n=1 Tax=Fonticula alba TaxID=691883 RepID=A0A058Z6X9_FONAL|nr:hypothetical protein H696_03500 [Fonticula alba]KCV70034.1 hypothetical protein H696_03500 [Fonticula alba]|eukprot:XP_009495640.1 hypothetical protein H696_03500 [Fonticula alba]
MVAALPPATHTLHLLAPPGDWGSASGSLVGIVSGVSAYAIVPPRSASQGRSPTTGPRSGQRANQPGHVQSTRLADVCRRMRPQVAAIEERYAKELERLAKSNLGEAEEGTMKTAWNQVKFDAENTARAHAKLALALNNEILGSGDPEPVVEANRLLRDYESAVGRDRKRIAAADQEVEKTRKTYISRMTDAERAGPSSGASSSRASLYGAPVSQSSERKKATLAANEYRRTVDEANEARRAWGDTVNLASLEYQNLEIRRINYLKQLLDSYLDTLQASRQSLEESSSMVRNSIQAVSTDVDIEMFVKSRGTGPHRPKPVEFHPFK